MKRATVTLVLATVLLSSVLVFAQDGKVQRVRFARGRTTAVLKGAVIRATKDRYILGARGGLGPDVDDGRRHLARDRPERRGVDRTGDRRAVGRRCDSQRLRRRGGRQFEPRRQHHADGH